MLHFLAYRTFHRRRRRRRITIRAVKTFLFFERRTRTRSFFSDVFVFAHFEPPSSVGKKKMVSVRVTLCIPHSRSIYKSVAIHEENGRYVFPFLAFEIFK